MVRARTVDDLLAEARRQIGRLSPAEAYQAIADGAVLIDLRCDDDRRREGTIDGAVHAAMAVLEWRADPLSGASDDRLTSGAQLITMCNDGYASSFSARNLRLLGHASAVDMIGGFREWQRQGLPVVPLDPGDQH